MNGAARLIVPVYDSLIAEVRQVETPVGFV
jgi:hypothetical protein